jgi:predicted metal-dependent peptidase
MTTAAAIAVPVECPEKALNKTKIALMGNHDLVFFTTVCLSLKHSFDDTIPTACTNGRWIKYNTAFFMKQTPAKRLGLMVHEIMHVAYNHMGRLLGKDMTKWNYATDYVINLQILDMGLELPAGGLVDRQYEGMSAEQVYDLIPDPPEDPAAQHFEMSDGEDPKALEEHITDILVKAATQARMSGKPGTIPGDILIMLDKLLNPVLPTKVLLKRFVDATAREDYSWQRFNRRYFPKHYLPSLYSESLDHVAVAVDASCSVTDDEFLRSVSEIAGTFRSVRPKRISVVVFDTGIRSVHKVRNINQLLRIEFKGRGGTAIGPVMQWAKENRPKVLLVLSDGEFGFREVENPKVPILWAINNHPGFEFKAPFGKVVRYGEPI